MKKKKRQRVVCVVLIVFFSSTFVVAQSGAQDCVTDTIITQIEQHDNPDGDAVIPPEVREMMDFCVHAWSMPAALSLSASTVTAIVLGANFSQSLAKPSIKLYAHYEPDTRRLVLRFNRPAIVQDTPKIVLLYQHEGVMTITTLDRGIDDGLVQRYDTDIDNTSTHMEAIVYPGTIHPAGFEERDICPDGRPIHVDVVITSRGA